jgi:exonuclease III
MIYSGVPENKWAVSGVAILIRKDWKNKIQDYTWISDRIVVTRPSLLNRNFTIMEVYALTEGKEQETEEFYNELQHVIHKITKKENIIIAGDFNGRIGNQPIPECIGQNREQVINHNGTALRDSGAFNKLKITKSYYRHKTIHKFT